MAFLQPTMALPQTSQTSSTAPETRSSIFSRRSARQLGLFAAGAGFFAITSVITRRSLVRRYKATIPKFYQPSNRANFEVNGAMEAFEALNIATINVLSVGMMASGGLLWAFDISSLDDMRQKVRTKMGAPGSLEDKDAEEEIEEWFATVLSRKEFKHLKGKEKELKDNKDEEETKP
ncbi:hypothetical protein G7Y89_g5624 [Cudoniella acicularis]|uniref:Altered inheritance of mitochondria protein 11 n=1 Tax=Cudoniella acicularis TaxID=354080 RepID=A0A8H4RPA6_9HELO|nr:hypothetical protein G7Y89_g5624 [Cudoniella acicularis]